MSKLNSSLLTPVSPPDGDGVFVFSPVPGLVFSEYGMEVTPGLDLSFDDWSKAGVSLANLQRRSYMIFMWGWGDWLNEGKRAYGEKYTQGMEITGLRYRTLANYTYVAAATPRHLRGIKGLSQRHYLVVAKIKDPVRKLQLLMDAAVNGWTASVELPRQIEAENLAGASSESASKSGSDQDINSDPPPSTLEDEIYSLQQEKYALEKSVVKLATHNGYLEDIIGHSIVVMREIEENVVTNLRACATILEDDISGLIAAIRETEDDVVTKVRVVVAILEAEPRGDVFEYIVAAIEKYKEGDMLAFTTFMNQLIILMEE